MDQHISYTEICRKPMTQLGGKFSALFSPRLETHKARYANKKVLKLN